jgi:hypothetical protein
MSDAKDKTAKPSFKGLTWYREQYFSLFIPLDWKQVERTDGRMGIIFLPSENDVHTLYSIDVVDLETEITSDDLPYLSMGFLDGIKNLPDRKIESKDEGVAGKLVKLQAKYTFTEDGETRKRWVRVLYDGTRQITVVAQGKTVETYDYWLPMFFEAMMTITVHDTMPTTMTS